MSSYWQAFTTPLAETLRRIISFVPRLLVAVVLFLLFYALAEFVRRTLRRWLKPAAHLPLSIQILIARSVYLLILLFGSLVALSAANVNVAVVLESVGVAGFALGFALKEVLENFIAGILLLFARPFEIGDQVTLRNFEGTIANIELRTTTLVTYDNERVAIPNSQIYTNAVVNHTALKQRRYLVAFDTSVTADAAQVEREALRAVTENPDVAREPSPLLRIARVDSGSDVLTWHLFYWAAPTKAVQVKTVSETLAAIKAALYDAGVPTPTPTSATLLQRMVAPANGSHPVNASNSETVEPNKSGANQSSV